MDKTLWEKVVKFHGHECSGLAIGFRAAEVAMEQLNVGFSKDEEVVCVTENDACGVDAIQFLLGTTFGKGNLIHRDRGKIAYSFFHRKTGESIRIISKRKKGEGDRKERQRIILQASQDDLFVIKKPFYDLPEKARIFQSMPCEICGEAVAEPNMRLQEGKIVCLDCND